MKILYIITQAEGGGAQKYTLTLAKHFKGNIAAGSEAHKLFNDAETLQLTTYKLTHLKREINPYHDFLAVWEIRQLIKTLQPDIVHLNSTKAGILGSFAAMGLKTKVIFTAHGFRYSEPLSYASKNFYLALEKVASSYRDFIITVSDSDRQSALKNGLINENKIKTIYNGLSPVTFLAKDEARSQLRLPPHVLVFGTLANFYKTKGLNVLIEAISKLPAEVKDKSVFVILGDGGERKHLEAQIKKHGLEKTVLLPGKFQNASQYLKAFDVFVLPSKKEGFPYALLEALQAGLPIIATNVGGIPEALGDAGVLVEANNPAALTKAITAMSTKISHKDPEIEKLSQKALMRAQVFTEERMLEETKKIYEKILNKS